MSKGRDLRYFDYVNQPYEKVRAALVKDAVPVFTAATTGASARADAVAAQLKLEIGVIKVGTDIAITVHSVGDLPKVGKQAPGTRIVFEWKAKEAARLFPLMRASLDIYPLTASETQLDFSGHYEVPLGLFGGAIDAVVGYRVAEATIHRFVDEVAEHLRTTLK
ncbi:MAG TPA: hypothetical protein VG916_15855 [Gemmatimonadaceae bacterium]|nr:hypothetical protein [Gemmatimonadaceae bacterium]